MIMCLPMPFRASAVATTVASGTIDDTMTWTLDSDGVLTIGGTGTWNERYSEGEWYSDYRKSVKTLVVEDGIVSDSFIFYDHFNLESVKLGNGITGLGRYAFPCPNLKTISFGNNIKTIGDGAFSECSVLSCITIPETVTTIGNNAFFGCTALTSIVIPHSVTSLGSRVFYQCTSLETAEIGNGVTSIKDEIFSGCLNLKTVSIGKSVESIGYAAFYGCTSLTDISIPDSVKGINRAAFWNCTALETVSLGKGLTSIGESTFDLCENIKSIVIPDSVETIGERAFYGCSKLSTIDLGNGVNTIKAWAFYNCAVANINIPASVTSLDPMAFEGYTVSFEGYSVDEANETYSNDENGILYNKEKTTLIRVPMGLIGTFNIPGSVNTIGESAFANCRNITAIEIPDSVGTIGYGAFAGCTNLKKVNLPNGILAIEQQMFNGCQSLESLTIPKSVTEIGTQIIENCSVLDAIYVMNKDVVFAYWSINQTNLTIYGYTNSTAQAYAESHNIPFVALDSNLVIVPDLTDTDYTIDSDGPFTVYSSGDLSELQSIKMDGNTVATSNYTLEEGSTIVKFKADYMDTLAEGEHTVTLVYTSGSVSTTLNVAANTCEHSYDNTCDTSCNLCGATRTVTHSWGAITSNDTQHWYKCSVCGQEKDRENHHGGTATCKDKANCVDCGKQYGDLAQCSYTAEVTETKYLKAAATCNTKAIYYKSCPVCGSFGTDTFTAGEFDKTNHKGETEIRGAVPATCGDPGYTGDTYCLDCDTKIANGTATNATGQHSGGTATCKEKAVCTTCGTAYGDFAKCEYTEEIAAAKYLKAAATCKDRAVYYKSCKVCGGVGTETFTYGEVDAANHTGGTEIRDAVAANCSNPGYTGDTYCLGCNAKLATGTATEKNDNHSGGTATCKEKAVCTICGDPYGDFAKHSYTEYKSNNDATCEKDGTKTATCAYGCGTTDTVADVGSAKGHDFKTYTSDENATCKADGTKTAKCENCDKTNTVADEGSKADHSYGDDNFCDWCGKDKSNPQTGDNTNLVLLTSIMVISLLMVAALIATIYRTKKTR